MINNIFQMNKYSKSIVYNYIPYLGNLSPVQNNLFGDANLVTNNENR